MTFVDLADAAAYADWRGARLPTEFEWQLAAADPSFERVEPWVWNLTDGVYSDGATRFVIVKGGSDYEPGRPATTSTVSTRRWRRARSTGTSTAVRATRRSAPSCCSPAWAWRVLARRLPARMGPGSSGRTWTMADGPLAGLRVIDVATLFAGPLAATFLGDFGADVTKVEHPRRPDAARGHGPQRDGVNLWWKTLGRNKRAATLNLSDAAGAEALLRLVERSDVLVENFRPGTLERWGLGPDRLLERNPRLVIARVTAFGQTGPYSRRPGFGSLAEAMSGFAALTGEAGRSADAAAVRARRRHRGARHELRGDDRAPQRRRQRARARWSTWRSSSRS